MSYSAEVTVRNEERKKIKMNWNWKNVILMSRHTIFRIEEEMKIDTVIIILRQ